MRTCSPDLRTLPSSTVPTLSARPDRLQVDCLALERERRGARRDLSVLMRARARISSSAIPSEKYSCSGSLLMLTNGSTAIERCVSSAALDAGSA